MPKPMTPSTNGRVGQYLKARQEQHGTRPAVPPDAGCYSAADLVRLDLPEPHRIVGPLPEGLTLLVSRPKLGKSWLALQLALAVSLGKVALGSWMPLQGSVLYLALEDNRRRLKSRLLRLLDGAAAPDNLLLMTNCPRIDDGGLETITTWVEEAESPRLIIVDTLAKVRSKQRVSSNAYADDYADVARLQSFADEHHIGLLANHHDRKAQSDDILDDVSGTIGITAAADTIWMLSWTAPLCRCFWS